MACSFRGLGSGISMEPVSSSLPCSSVYVNTFSCRNGFPDYICRGNIPDNPMCEIFDRVVQIFQYNRYCLCVWREILYSKFRRYVLSVSCVFNEEFSLCINSAAFKFQHLIFHSGNVLSKIHTEIFFVAHITATNKTKQATATQKCRGCCREKITFSLWNRSRPHRARCQKAPPPPRTVQAETAR